MHIHSHFNPPPASSNQEGTATSTGHAEGDGEPDNRRGFRWIHSMFLYTPTCKFMFEDDQRLIVDSIDERTD